MYFNREFPYIFVYCFSCRYLVQLGLRQLGPPVPTTSLAIYCGYDALVLSAIEAQKSFQVRLAKVVRGSLTNQVPFLPQPSSIPPPPPRTKTLLTPTKLNVENIGKLGLLCGYPKSTCKNNYLLVEASPSPTKTCGKARKRTRVSVSQATKNLPQSLNILQRFPRVTKHRVTTPEKPRKIPRTPQRPCRTSQRPRKAL